MIENYTDAITRFWDFVVHDTPPPPVNNEDVSKIYATSNGQMMPWNSDVDSLIQKYIKIKRKHKLDKEEIDTIGIDIKNRIGHYDYFTLKTGAKVKLTRVNKFNEDKLREINKEVHSKFITKFDASAFKKYDEELYDECCDKVQLRLDLPRSNPN
tara:strand:- start:155 stop:619 length:465 start_codon:yes stop_codon:yes gene_type:complete